MELFDGFSALQIAVAALATLSAAFVRGLTGFGFGILLVPILALALSPIEAVLAINVMAALLALTEIRLIAREAERSAYVIAALVVA
ncbi:MAG: sulfite exporter TauE/SafE family protein, partial [Pseudomonadota bacterium]